MTIFIIGGEVEVYFLAKAFVSKGHQITVINSDDNFCKKLSRSLNVTAVVGDGSKPYVLEESGVAYAEMVIALAKKDADNLIICQVASKLYGIARTFAVVNDPRNIEVFKKLGVETVISTPDIISSLIEQRAVTEDIQNLMPVADGRLALMQVQVKQNHPVVDKKIAQLSFPDKGIISCILRESHVIIPRGNTQIKCNDQLIIMCQPDAQSQILNAIRGRVD